MNIKIAIASRLSYYFCGSVSLSILNTEDNPVSLDLDKLSKQEVIGLSKALKTKVIKVTEGESELILKASEYKLPKIKEKVSTDVVVSSLIEETVETIIETPIEVVSEETVEDIVETEVKEEIKPVTRRRTVTKK